MKKPFVTVVIPVWNGASVIQDTLYALYNNTEAESFELICVDNASTDESAKHIQMHFPQVRLLHQPVNLGFAGGVNLGINLAQTELIVLLNQDCLVEPNWLDHLLAGLAANPNFGVVGCTILNSDGSINHTGARITEPLLQGQHLTEISSPHHTFDYVTGALLAIRRSTIATVGLFDEGFYPAYYEDVDYCFRVRTKGLEVGYIPECRARHLFSGRTWKENPLQYCADHHYSRYRFATKHLAQEKLIKFFVAESNACEQETYYDQSLGRVLAIRRIFLDLHSIFRSRETDLQNALSLPQQRLVRINFAEILHLSLQKTLRMLHGEDAPVEKPNLHFSNSSDAATPNQDAKFAVETLTHPTQKGNSWNSQPLSKGEFSGESIATHQVNQDQTLNESKFDPSPVNSRSVVSSEQLAYLAHLQEATEHILAEIYLVPQLSPVGEEQRKNDLQTKILQAASFLSGRDYWLHRKLIYNSILRLEYDSKAINLLESYVAQFDDYKQQVHSLQEQLQQSMRHIAFLERQINVLVNKMDVIVKMINYEGR